MRAAVLFKERGKNARGAGDPMFPASRSVAARELILAGLAERWGYLDASKNPDLDDIAASYAQATFLVAYLGTRLIGTGAIVREAEGVGRIVRMSVAGHLRRRGIEKRIFQSLCLCARAEGYRQVVLETTSGWHDAIKFGSPAESVGAGAEKKSA